MGYTATVHSEGATPPSSKVPSLLKLLFLLVPSGAVQFLVFPSF